MGMRRVNDHSSSLVADLGFGLIRLKRLALLLTVLGAFENAAVAQAPPAIAIQPVSQTVRVGDTVTLLVTATGAGPFTYQWQVNDTNLPNGVILTVAGGGAGDNGAATNASLIFPRAVAVDAAGNLFIADTGNNRMRKVDTHGIITTVAGTGISGYSGDGRAATSARLYLPSGVAMDTAGNLFIADAGNNRVRRLGTDGIITVVAGNGKTGYLGDGGAATNASLGGGLWGYGLGAIAVDGSGDLFVADPIHNIIRKVDTNGIITTVAGNRDPGYSGDGAAATNASLNQALGVAADTAGNLFIADSFNYVIRKVATNGIITTVAGNGMRSYSGDGGAATNAGLGILSGLAADAVGNLYIAASDHNRIRKVDANGVITTVVGNGSLGYTGDGGKSTNASLNNPDGVAMDSAGDLFIADSGNDRIRKVSSTGIITTVAGSGPDYLGDGESATNATVNNPNGVTVDHAGNLFIADSGHYRVRRIATNGTITSVAGNGIWGFSGDGGAATNASLNWPSSAAPDADENLFIADSVNNRIRKVDARGVITTVAGNGNSGYSGDGGAATNASLLGPFGVAVDAGGILFIADRVNNVVRRVGPNGVISTVAGNGNAGYSGDGGPATNASFYYPDGLAVDSAGNLFVADTSNARARRVGTDGVVTTVAGGGTNYPGDFGPATNASLSVAAVAADVAGNLFISDTANHRIRKVGTNGMIVTVAGNGSGGYSGDGGAATDASLDYPQGVAVDAAGNLFIADFGNNRIRKVAFVGLPMLTLSNVSAVNGGDYRVIVTSPYGSITSAVASLTVASPPVVLPPLVITKISGPVVLLLMTNASPLAIYLLQTATNLSPPIQWQPVITNHADSLGNWILLDTIDTGDPVRFYRLQQRSP